MSHLGDQALPSVCGRVRRVPLLQILAEYMDSNKCVEELLKQLEEEQLHVRREKLAAARLWREVLRTKGEGTMWEKLIQKLEEERALRLDREKHLQEVTEGSEVGRVQMVSLQQHFSRMEETVRTLLQNQGALDPSALDTVDLMKAYKDKLSEEVRKRRESLEEEEAQPGSGGGGAEEDRDKETKALLERLRALEAENSALAMENESQREQYERCLDEVANQVVQALLTQKDLREECLKLRTRVFDLEQQNRTLSVLFQQRVRPASDLLLQKLHSRIMGLSAGDLILDPEKSKNFLLSRNSDSPPQDAQLNGKAGVPVGRFPSQLSLTVPAAGGGGGYPRSSCSSSELSLSSACSDFSSGSHTWNEGRSSGRLSSLNWEKRSSLGSSAPSNICGPAEEQLPARKKECHILEGLRRLQRRKPKGSSRSGDSKSGYKDCMNSNEGIYSLGTKCRSQTAPKPSSADKTAGLWAGDKGFVYDSDDADDEFPRPCSTDRWVPSHGKSDGLCGPMEKLNAGVGAASPKRPAVTGYDSKERPEKLTSFLSGFFFSGGRARTTANPSLLPCEVSHVEASLSHPHHSDSDEPGDLESSSGRLASQPGRDPRRLSRGFEEKLAPRCLRKDHNRAQSADSRPRPLSLIDRPKVSKSAQSEECLAMAFNREQPVEYGSQHLAVMGQNAIPRRRPQSACISEYTQLVSQGRPTCQRGGDVRNYIVLESPEKPVELHSPRMGRKSILHQSEDSQQQKPTRSPNNRAQKGHSVPPMVNGASGPKANLTKIPGRSRESPLKVSTESGGGASVAPPSQERSPSSPPVKLSKFGRPPGCGYSAQSPRAAHPSSKLPCRTEWGKGPTSSIPGSPLLTRRHLEPMDCGELPTHDVGQQLELRSPSPPPPPGRSTSLLIRPNYEGTPQALRPGFHQNTPSTVRVAPHGSQTHPHASPSVLNGQHPGTHKSQDTALWDASYNTEAVPQRLVEGPSHPFQKSPVSCRTPLRGSPKKVTAKLYPSSASGHAPDLHDTISKGSKNSLQKGQSLQNTNCGKKGQLPENGYPQLYKTSGSLPISLQGHSPDVIGSCGSAFLPSQAMSDPAVLGLSPQNSAERVTKTRIPLGMKALVKSPAVLRESSSVSEQQDKDHTNSTSKGPAATSSTFSLRLRPEIRCSSMDGELLPPVVAEDGSLCEEMDAEGRLFKRSISVSTKPHLKPALGMNGAKARSQSFSTHYMQKPCIGTSEGAGKVRTHIITNTGDRGSSLTRQSSLGDGFQPRSAGGSRESLPQCAVNTRQGPHGCMTGSSSNHGLPGKSAARASAQKEVRSLPLIDRFGPRSSRRPAKVASHPQFDSESFPVYNPELKVEGVGTRLPATNKFDLARSISKQQAGGGGGKGLEEPEKLVSPSTTCTIEEKVMMGIQENVQRGQELSKSQASEAKHRTGSSIANWFGFRKSKLPALGGKKNDAPKGKEEKKESKEEKKESKIGSVLGGRQTKPDKAKDKTKNEMHYRDSHDQAITENRDKLDSIMDQCHFQMGQHTNQIQHSVSYMGKEQFMKEILIRSVTKGSSHGASLPGIPNSPQGISIEKRGMGEDIEIHVDAKTKSVTQKINLRGEAEADLEPEPNCQDHMIGSSCQTRTLDSGIGTFPLPDSVARATGRQLPKSASSPGQALAAPAEPAKDPTSTSPPKPQVPSKSSHETPHDASHALPDCAESSRDVRDLQTHLAKPTTSGVMKGQRLSKSEYRTSPAQSPEDHGKEKVKRKNSNQSPPTDGTLRFSAYSGSSGSGGETDGELDPASAAVCLGRDASLSETGRTRRAYQEEEEELRKGSVQNHLSIMEYYQQEVLIHYRREEQREADQYSSTDRERKPQQKKNKMADSTGEESQLIFPGVSLESLNALNSNGGPRPETERKSGPDEAAGRGRERRTEEPSSGCSDQPGADSLGSLSDSLYDSFSSCTSQGSSEV
ncbi:nck-associated protein 5-like isoform X1 [Anguilla anguilla]|uniref:nck-associated protein 5-like isoform X1 n=2 Tax=Anguilla anguilla TaxID=7936 RepID=UPI0015A7D99B|nr:nck-associated protein 5-like isoform X1 [Anguilla anguilla]